MDDRAEPCLSVVMPCYNEAATVREAMARVLASPFTRELIVVDDDSRDGSAEIAQTVRDRRVRVVRQPVNRGKGAAIRRGIVEVQAPFVVIQDGDLETDPGEFRALLGPLLDGRADVVYGSRFAARPERRVTGFRHSWTNRALTFLSNLFTDLDLSDMETCFKAFRREVIQSLPLREDRFGFEPEVTALVAAGRYRVFEVPISYDPRGAGSGKKISWQDGVRALYCIVRYSPVLAGLWRRESQPETPTARLEPLPLAEEFTA